jgi:uncharacterized protein YndB with AHSA1/START domain
MTCKAAQHFSAPTNVVFTILADPERAARWLTPDAGPHPDHAYRLSVVPAELSVRWAPDAHDSGWSGRALVRDASDGGSVVYLELTTHSGAERSLGVDGLLSGAIRRLAVEIEATVSPA